MSKWILKNNSNRQKGVALFIAIISAGVLLLIALAISDLSYKEQVITISAKESKEAFYAADTGLECALYWDVIHGNFVEGGNGDEITCVGINKDISGNQIPANSDGSITPINFNNSTLGKEYCFTITVTKEVQDTGSIRTSILSQGYNTCNEDDPRRLERALEAHY